MNDNKNWIPAFAGMTRFPLIVTQPQKGGRGDFCGGLVPEIPPGPSFVKGGKTTPGALPLPRPGGADRLGES